MSQTWPSQISGEALLALIEEGKTDRLRITKQIDELSKGLVEFAKVLGERDSKAYRMMPAEAMDPKNSKEIRTALLHAIWANTLMGNADAAKGFSETLIILQGLHGT